MFIQTSEEAKDRISQVKAERDYVLDSIQRGQLKCNGKVLYTQVKKEYNNKIDAITIYEGLKDILDSGFNYDEVHGCKGLYRLNSRNAFEYLVSLFPSENVLVGHDSYSYNDYYSSRDYYVVMLDLNTIVGFKLIATRKSSMYTYDLSIDKISSSKPLEIMCGHFEQRKFHRAYIYSPDNSCPGFLFSAKKEVPECDGKKLYDLIKPVDVSQTLDIIEEQYGIKDVQPVRGMIN